MVPQLVLDPGDPEDEALLTFCLDDTPPGEAAAFDIWIDLRRVQDWAKRLRDALPQRLDVGNRDDPVSVTLYPTERRGVAAVVIESDPEGHMSGRGTWVPPRLWLVDRAVFCNALDGALADAGVDRNDIERPVW